MSVLPVVVAGRAAAESLMRSTVRVTRFTGATVVSDVPPFETVRERVVLYEGKGKLQSHEAHEQSVTVGGASTVITRVRADFPVGAFTAQPGDLVEVLGNVDDPMLVGRVFRVAGIAPYKSIATAYRVYVDEVSPGD